MYITQDHKYELICFVYDDNSKHGKIVNGYKVLGNVEYLESFEDKITFQYSFLLATMM